jgi:hypothetical protein
VLYEENGRRNWKMKGEKKQKRNMKGTRRKTYLETQWKNHEQQQ